MKTHKKRISICCNTNLIYLARARRKGSLHFYQNKNAHSWLKIFDLCCICIVSFFLCFVKK